MTEQTNDARQESRLQRLVGLRDNWDGYGSPAPNAAECNAARELLDRLPWGKWQVVPMSGGGLQIERHADGIDVEISVRALKPNGQLQGAARSAVGPGSDS